MFAIILVINIIMNITSVNNDNYYLGRTLLILAAMNDNTEAVSLLLAAGADVNAQDNKGNFI